ncbi:MAG TPA: hypothetical protein D7I06_05595 [Candidatus Poseidoniales archaeon]|jgi:hypothetical protein|nr:MAG TPA: hypothetical protein D7I06_05595 [Candidatus Poseidoniales archaeon]HII63060.1 hypothetical protein [Candidatus Poseidoniaceae archaeon]|tara:strand:+ start:894 stop:1322 length:429 start_codon:yes stop_codon:yes gene_type:complete
MAAERMSRRCRKYLRDIQKSTSRYELQVVASTIQSELDRRNISYDEALTLGNILQTRADAMPGDQIVYAVSDRDSYRRTIELYLKDGILTATEQLLLWEERRRLGITDDDHDRLLQQLLVQWQKSGKSVTIHNFQRGGAKDA